MIAWIKKLVSPELTVEDVEQGAAFLSKIMGVPFFSSEHPGPDMSEVVKKCGAPTRIFKDTRHDN